jgi:hypothetical protein
VSPRLRVVAAGAFVAVLAFGATLFLLGRGQSAAPEPKVIKPLHPVKKSRRVASAARARRAAAKTTVKPRAKAKRAPAVIDGLPAALARALASHKVVVVALYAPNARVDVLAEREARAGAATAGAGFVALDVTSERQTRPLTSLLASAPQQVDRQLDSPAVLVFQQPKTLFVRLNGFNDAATVAQAAQNAAPTVLGAVTEVTGEASWTAAANEVCRDLKARVARLTFPGSAEQILPFVRQLADTVQTGVQRLKALKAPPGTRAKVAAMVAAYEEMLRDVRGMIAAAHDRAARERLAARATAAGLRGDRIAYSLGATDCGS